MECRNCIGSCLRGFPPTFQKLAGRWFSYAKVSFIVLNACKHGVLQWTSIPSWVYTCFTPSVPGIGSVSTLALEKIRWLLRNQAILRSVSVLRCAASIIPQFTMQFLHLFQHTICTKTIYYFTSFLKNNFKKSIQSKSLINTQRQSEIKNLSLLISHTWGL